MKGFINIKDGLENRNDIMKDLYTLDILFLIEVDDVNSENKKMIRKFANRLDKFKLKTKEILDRNLGEDPVLIGNLVTFHEDSFDNSLIPKETGIFERCISDSIMPILFTNRTAASSSDSFHQELVKNIDVIKAQIEAVANKFELSGEYIGKVFKSTDATSTENKPEIIELERFQGKFEIIKEKTVDEKFVKSISSGSSRQKIEMLILKKDSINRIFYGILCLFGLIFFSWLGVESNFDSGYWIILPFLDLFVMIILMCFGFGIWFLYCGIKGFKEYRRIVNNE